MQIAWNLRIRDVTRVTLRILVVENAIDALNPHASLTNIRNRRTVFGRPREELPDEMENAVQHATIKLTDRVQRTLNLLTSNDVFDHLGIREWTKLLKLGELICVPDHSPQTQLPGMLDDAADVENRAISRLQEIFLALTNALINYFQEKITLAFQTMQYSPNSAAVDKDRKCYVPRSQFAGTLSVYETLTREQRFLTRFPWGRLQAQLNVEDMERHCNILGSGRFGSTIICTLVANFNQGMEEAYWLPNPEMQQGAGFSAVTFHEELSSAVRGLVTRWAYPLDLEVSLNRSKHLALGLTDEDMNFLPLWAGGCDDGTGGAFEEGAVPDTDMGAMGPGPSFHTGDSVMTDVSSIAPSAPTVSGESDMTATAGRSIMAAPSRTAMSTVTGGFASSIAPSSVFTPEEGSIFSDDNEITGEAAGLPLRFRQS